MTGWQHDLNGDPVSWLLDPENPSARYWTLVDILHRRVDDPEVVAARAAVVEQPLVQKLFALQRREGIGATTRPNHTPPKVP